MVHANLLYQNFHFFHDVFDKVVNYNNVWSIPYINIDIKNNERYMTSKHYFIIINIAKYLLAYNNEYLL